MAELRTLYKKILALDSLSPNRETNALFSRLVTLAVSQKVSQKKTELKPSEMLKLQKVCSAAEYELEKFWAQKILAAKNPGAAVRKFPYYGNYAKLTQLEWLSLLGCTSHRNHKVIFIGGGPLPMTAIFLAQVYGQRITILEKEKEASDLSTKLCVALGLQNRIRIVNVAAEDFPGYKNFNAFFVAALAGVELRAKSAIIARIQKLAPAHSHILARSSWGSREILYRPFELRSNRTKTIVEVRPHNDVVNSFYIMHT